MFLYVALLAVLPLPVTRSLDTSLHRLDKIPITCDAGAFIAGHHGSVTCNFHRDMNADKRGINVVRYSLDAADNDPGTNALTCGWQREKQRYHCIAGDGFMFDDSISDRLTVQIPAVRDDYGGLYMCFIIPSEETQKHACELNVKGSYPTTTPGPNDTVPHGHDWKDGPSHLWVIPVIVAIVIATVVLLLVWKFLIWDTRQHNNNQADEAEAQLLNTPNDPSLSQHPAASKAGQSTCSKKRTPILKGFHLLMLDCERVLKLLIRGIVASASTYVKKRTSVLPMPTEKDTRAFTSAVKGGFLSIGLASDGVDVRYVALLGPQTEIQSARYSLQTHASADYDLTKFFFSVAVCVKQFLKDNKLTYKAFPVEFVFCSPFGAECEVTMEHLRQYTTGLISDADMDRDPTEMLQHALRRINITHKLRIKPTVKAPEGTLLSGFYRDRCTSAFVHSVELAACYVSQKNNVQQEQEITTIDLGALGETGVLDVLRTDFDTELDNYSANPGEKILEKMVSYRYMGELLRLVLRKLVQEGKLSMFVPRSSPLRIRNGLTIKHVSLIQSDRDGHNGMTKLVLDELNVKNYTAEDCNTVREACNTIVDRSAHLTAVALAAMITFLRQPEDRGDPEPKAKAELKIAVDGYMRRDFPEFSHTVEDLTKKLLPEDFKFKLLPQYHGRRVGAALLNNNDKDKKDQ